VTNGNKREKPLYLDMDPDEAFERFLQTDPKELKDRIDKKKAPPKRGQGVDGKARPKSKPSD